MNRSPNKTAQGLGQSVTVLLTQVTFTLAWVLEGGAHVTRGLDSDSD